MYTHIPTAAPHGRRTGSKAIGRGREGERWAAGSQRPSEANQPLADFTDGSKKADKSDQNSLGQEPI